MFDTNRFIITLGIFLEVNLLVAFIDDPREWQRLDWSILQNGSINLYYRKQILYEDLDWFSENNYKKFEFDCSTWTSDKDFHVNVKNKFGFPDYYGENLNAFNDCLRGIDIPYHSGVVIAFLGYDSFYDKFPDTAQNILDIIEVNSRRFLLTGRRMISLIQTNDPNILLTPVGACPILWNRKEWVKSCRSL